MASVMTEIVVSADLDGCALCGLPRTGHGERQGMAHLGEDRPKIYVSPSIDLRARRVLARRSGNYEIAEVDATTGAPSTFFLRSRCACGEAVLAISDHIVTARCETCMRASVE